MLSMSHSQAYQEFLTLLKKFNDDFSSFNDEIDIKAVQKQFQPIKIFFQQQIVGLATQQLDEAIATRWQSLQTELYREFRLLDTDILFLASSRQAKTKMQRLKSVSDRLERIIGYCSAIIALLGLEIGD
ncbi:MAG: heterocyst frequency control protein PatD [Xenococcaceae cyanobacterium MO_188.B32]|nr:heterocyst frequency control protein PatD [Xenococcaceae cyanobacterium MO_188.B32]